MSGLECINDRLRKHEEEIGKFALTSKFVDVLAESTINTHLKALFRVTLPEQMFASSSQTRFNMRNSYKNSGVWAEWRDHLIARIESPVIILENVVSSY